MLENLFLEMLQVSLGSCTFLSRAPSFVEWKVLYQEVLRHFLIGMSLCKLPLFRDSHILDCINNLKTIKNYHTFDTISFNNNALLQC